MVLGIQIRKKDKQTQRQTTNIQNRQTEIQAKTTHGIKKRKDIWIGRRDFYGKFSFFLFCISCPKLYFISEVEAKSGPTLITIKKGTHS